MRRPLKRMIWPCVHCKKPARQHGPNRECLFEPTTYWAMTSDEGWAALTLDAARDAFEYLVGQSYGTLDELCAMYQGYLDRWLTRVAQLENITPPKVAVTPDHEGYRTLSVHLELRPEWPMAQVCKVRF